MRRELICVERNTHHCSETKRALTTFVEAAGSENRANRAVSADGAGQQSTTAVTRVSRFCRFTSGSTILLSYYDYL
jgi:hypothetical protein